MIRSDGGVWIRAGGDRENLIVKQSPAGGIALLPGTRGEAGGKTTEVLADGAACSTTTPGG
ncbi:hypothetical protein [Pantoea sp. 1.19]|uniref:hypothetical protein n=1 Tax=Pantoea sp. 1.19 TaxID=1925589 RepID=UPI000949141B|nr:hypothetical protein [Pantoea sp. 1.19]